MESWVVPYGYAGESGALQEGVEGVSIIYLFI